MNSARLARQVTLVIGGSAIVAMGALTASCSSTKEEPKTTTTPTSAPASSAPVLTPTEKAAGGPNTFTPTLNPPHTGDTSVHLSNGVCTR